MKTNNGPLTQQHTNLQTHTDLTQNQAQ